MRTATAATRWACVLGAFVSAAACSRNGAAGPTPAPVSEVADHETAARAGPDLTESPVIGAEAGLEATWLTAGADGPTFAAAIAPFLDAPVPASASDLAMWESNGLRVVRVPMDGWPALSNALDVSRAAQRQWLAPSGRWTEIVRAPEEPRGQVVALDAERVELGPGRLRLLSRCWLAPVPPSGSNPGSSVRAEVTIEMVPQLLERRPAPASLVQAPRARDPIDEGLVFSRTRMRLRIREEAGGPFAYVIVSERPDVDWRTQIADRPESESPPQRDGPRPPPGVGEVVRNGGDDSDAGPAPIAAPKTGSEAAGPGGAGPAARSLPTLGEALFAAAPPQAASTGNPEAAVAARRGSRAVLVLIPRAPSEYHLFPAAPTVAPERAELAR